MLADKMPVESVGGDGSCPDPHAAAATEAEPNTSHGFIIPRIVITHAPERPRYSESVPEQTYDKAVLFVPVRTEELSWDAGGLYWNGTYAYPVHSIYSKEGTAIGRRRNGPAGYKFAEMFESRRPSLSVFDDEGDDPIGEAARLGRATPAVDEAEVIFEEPAPVPLAPSDATHQVEVVDPNPAAADDAADDGSLYGESDPLSLFSRRDSTDSAATTPGLASPPTLVTDIGRRDVAKPSTSALDTGLLCQKLEAESTKQGDRATDAAADTCTVVDEEPSSLDRGRLLAQGWTHLGSIPRRSPNGHMSKQRAATLPDNGKDRFGFSKSLRLDTALELSEKHRSVSVPASPVLDGTAFAEPIVESPTSSAPVLPAPQLIDSAHRRGISNGPRRAITVSRRSSSSSIFSSMADDLTQSAFTPEKKAPSRRSSLSSKPSLRRKHRFDDEFALDADYSAGWAFEQGASSLRNEWQMS